LSQGKAETQLALPSDGRKCSRFPATKTGNTVLRRGEVAHADARPSSSTVSEFCAAFLKHAKQYYRKDGKPTGAADVYRPVLKLLKTIFGKTRAAEFGPLAAKALLGRMLSEGASRSRIGALAIGN